ncbi:MAG: pyridoxamine 5'-phosphate oxidase family protein [Candidatus Margulisiibacteriota bacterium]
MASDFNLMQLDHVSVPNDLLAFAKNELILGVKQSNHPFHTCVLGSMTLEGNPDLRTVVSRGVNSEFDQVRVHSDQRSLKNQQLQQHKDVALLYYSPQQKLQVRLKGKATVVNHGDINTDFFASSTPHSQICYAYPLAPGTPIDLPKKETMFNEINVSQIDQIKPQALANFSHIIIHFNSADILWLNRRGHIRVASQLTDSGWNSKFIVA